MPKKFLLCVLFIILLSASCGPVTFAQPQTSSAPATLPPTWTPTQPTAIPTVTEFPTFTPVPPLPPLATPVNDSLGALSERFQDSLFSPTGQWVAYRDPEKLRVVNSEDPLRYWTLPCELFEECSTVYPVKWSRNGRILYFAPAPKSGGAPEGISLLTALAMIDVRNGEWELILPDSERHYDFSFSPDEDYLAYTQSGGTQEQAEDASEEPSVTVGVLSLADKQWPHQIYTLDGTFGGNFIWSPFKPRFVFVTYDPKTGSSVGYYDIETSFIKYALEADKRDIILTDWGQDNLVSLEIKDWVTQSRTHRELNPFTGELTGD